jgi:uncharacterized protein (DUF2141 family)
VPPARALRFLLGPAVAVVVAASPAAAGAEWAPDVKAALAYAHARKGEVRFAVRTDRHLWGYRRTAGARSASVVKALFLVAYLDDPRKQTLRGVFARLLRGLEPQLVPTAR